MTNPAPTPPITLDSQEGRSVRLRVGLQHLRAYSRHFARQLEAEKAMSALKSANPCIYEFERLQRQAEDAAKLAQSEACSAALFIGPALDSEIEDEGSEP